MSFFNRILKVLDGKARRFNQAELWAVRYFPKQNHVAARTVRVVVEQSGVGFERLKPFTRFIEDLGMDELEPVELQMALEEEFGFEISTDDAASISTLGALISYLHDKVQTHVARGH